MLLGSRKKILEVQSFVVRMVNNCCPELRSLMEGPRLERRVNLTQVVLVIPEEKGQPLVKDAFPVVTKEFSSNGVALVLDHPRPLDHVVLAFRWEGEMRFVRARACHLHPMGAGFYQVGMRMVEMLHESDCPALKKVHF